MVLFLTISFILYVVPNKKKLSSGNPTITQYTYSNDPSVKNGLFFHPLRGFLKDKARVLLIIWRPKMKPFYDFLFSTKICLFLNKFNLEWEKFLHLVYIVYCIMNSFVVKCHTVYLCTALNGYQNARPLLYTCQTMKLWFLLKNRYSTAYYIKIMT